MRLVPMAADDFLRGPDWDSVSFMQGPTRWIIGLLLAAVIIYALVMIVVSLLKLPGADRNKARYTGETIFFSVIAIFVAFTFQDVFASLISSMV